MNLFPNKFYGQPSTNENEIKVFESLNIKGVFGMINEWAYTSLKGSKELSIIFFSWTTLHEF